MNKRQPLVESFLRQAVIIESDRDKLPDGVLRRVNYLICNVDEKNRNKRRYGWDVWDSVKQDVEVQESLKNRCMTCCEEHPADEETTTTSRLTAVVTDILEDRDNNKVYAQFDILDTPMGRIVDTAIKADVGIGVSTRADGELEEELDEDSGEKGYRVIPESYKFETIDFTAKPSTYGSELPIQGQDEIAGIVSDSLVARKMELDTAVSILESLTSKKAVALYERVKKSKGVREALVADLLDDDSLMRYRDNLLQDVDTYEQLTDEEKKDTFQKSQIDTIKAELKDVKGEIKKRGILESAIKEQWEDTASPLIKAHTKQDGVKFVVAPGEVRGEVGLFKIGEDDKMDSVDVGLLGLDVVNGKLKDNDLPELSEDMYKEITKELDKAAGSDDEPVKDEPVKEGAIEDFAEKHNMELVFSKGHRAYDRILYDKAEGKYYDRHTDLYLRDEELDKYGLGARGRDVVTVVKDTVDETIDEASVEGVAKMSDPLLKGNYKRLTGKKVKSDKESAFEDILKAEMEKREISVEEGVNESGEKRILTKEVEVAAGTTTQNPTGSRHWLKAGTPVEIDVARDGTIWLESDEGRFKIPRQFGGRFDYSGWIDGVSKAPEAVTTGENEAVTSGAEGIAKFAEYAKKVDFALLSGIGEGLGLWEVPEDQLDEPALRKFVGDNIVKLSAEDLNKLLDAANKMVGDMPESVAVDMGVGVADVDKDSLKAGIAVELEHTDLSSMGLDKRIEMANGYVDASLEGADDKDIDALQRAEKIALDHVAEDKDYYVKLDKARLAESVDSFVFMSLKDSVVEDSLKEALVSSNTLPEKVGKLIEYITTLRKEGALKNAQVQLLETAGAVDKEVPIKEFVANIKKHQAALKVLEQALREQANKHTVEVKALLKSQKAESQKIYRAKLKEGVEKAANAVKKVFTDKIKDIKEAYENDVRAVKETAAKDIFKATVIDRVVKESNLTIPSEAQALLERCTTEDEVRGIVGDLRIQLRESLLHSNKGVELKLAETKVTNEMSDNFKDTLDMLLDSIR